MSITIPENVTGIDNKAFANCGSLVTVNIETKKMTAIPAACFSGCASLKNINIPNGIESIGNNALMDVSLLRV